MKRKTVSPNNKWARIGAMLLALCFLAASAYAEDAALQSFFGDSEAADVKIDKSEVILTEEVWQNSAEVISRLFSYELLEELDKRNQLMPEYANSIDECADPNLLYILPDGCVYENMQRMTGEIRNELLFASDVGRVAFNGGLGYVDNMRYSTSSFSDKVTEGWDVTGFIPAKAGDTIRLQDVDFFDFASSSSRARFIYFDRAYQYVSCSDFFGSIGDMTSDWNPVANDDGQLVRCVIPDSLASEIAYIRLTVSDIRPESIVTVNNLLEGFAPASKWYSIEKIAIDELNRADEPETVPVETAPVETVAAAAEPELPDYWKEHLDVKVDEIRQRMEEAGKNKSAFLWYTDSHWSWSSCMSPKLLTYLYEKTPINKTVFGGDIVYAEPTVDTFDDRSIMAYLWDWREAVRGLPHHHSVVGNHDVGTFTKGIFPSDYVYAYLLAPEECSDIVSGSDFNYYIDDPCEKTRYFYLDTAYQYIVYSEEQMAWLKESIKATPAGWHIVVFAHAWVDVDYDQEPPALEGLSEAGTILLDLFDAYNSREDEFADAAAKVEFCIGGHSHVDSIFMSEMGIPVITTETDSLNVRSGLSDDLGTINESSVNAVIADYETNTIYIERVGRGEDMIIEY